MANGCWIYPLLFSLHTTIYTITSVFLWVLRHEINREWLAISCLKVNFRIWYLYLWDSFTTLFSFLSRLITPTFSLFFTMPICSQLSFLSPLTIFSLFTFVYLHSMFDLLVSLSVLLLNLCAALPPLSFPCASFCFQPSLSGPFLFLSIFSSFHCL